MLEARNALLEKISYLNAKVSALPDEVSVKLRILLFAVVPLPPQYLCCILQLIM